MKFDISAGAALMFSALYFFDETGMFSVLLIAVIVHEAGHIAAIKMLGGRISKISIDMSGAVIDHSGQYEGIKAAITAAAGPVLGFAYALLASRAGNRFDSRFLLCSSGVSAAFSIINLVPAFPLDGAEIMLILLSKVFGPPRAETAMQIISMLISLMGIFFGIGAVRGGYGAGLLVFAVWLMCFVLKRPLVI